MNGARLKASRPPELENRIRALEHHERLIDAVRSSGDLGSAVVTRRKLWFLVRYLEHLDARRECFEDAPMESIEVWVLTERNRCLSLCSLRSIYRTAIRSGLATCSPVESLRCRLAVREAHRLSTVEARQVVTVILGDDGHPFLQLPAWRDLAMTALAMWKPRTPAGLAALRWGDMSMHEDTPSTIVAIIGRLRELLLSEGVDVMDIDALLPSLHPSVRFAWRGRTRLPLAPLGPAGLMQAIHRRFREAGVIGPSGMPPGYTNVIWLACPSLDELEARLAPARAHMVPGILTTR